MDQTVPLHGGPNVMLIAALTPVGSGALFRVNGAVDGAVFTAYLDQVLGPRCGRARRGGAGRQKIRGAAATPSPVVPRF